MLKRILIVDDEPETMQKLINLTNLNNLGYSLCAILNDGREAMEYLKNNPVDVVVTDIIMTFVSGLELCAHIKENYPHIYTIILSGYDDFKYAQSAIGLGVYRYILKPVSLKEFHGVLSDVIGEMSRKEKKKLTDISVATETVSLMKKRLFTEYLFGNISSEEFAQKIKVYSPADIDILYSSGVLAEIEMLNFKNFISNSWSYSHDSFNMALERLVSMYEDMFTVLTDIDDNKFEIIIFHNKDISSDIVLSKFVRLFKEITNIDTNIVCQKSFDEFTGLSGYYLSNCKSGSRIIHQRVRRLGNSFAEYVLSGDAASAETCRNNIYILLRSLSLNEAKYMALELLKPYEEQVPNAEQHIYAAQNVETLIISMNNLTKSLINIDRTKHQGKFIAEAKEYINTHYTEDITLEAVADYVHLNHIYFSRLFKQITGENYSDYLMNLRMSKACELLKTTKLKIYEVSLNVGYKNVKYFSEIFKKNMGVLPSEYRNMTK